MYRPSANTENSRRKREKPLIPRVQDMTYILDTKRLAVVYAGTIRAICTDLSVKKKNRKKPIYKLSMQQHEEIIGSM